MYERHGAVKPQPNNHHAIFSSHVLLSHVKPRDGDAIAPPAGGGRETRDVRREKSGDDRRQDVRREMIRRLGSKKINDSSTKLQ